jgi:hypothetical protein
MRKPFFTNTPTVARIMAAERGLQLKGGGGGDGGAVDGSRWVARLLRATGRTLFAAEGCWQQPSHPHAHNHARVRGPPFAAAAARRRLLPGGLKGALWRDWSIAPGVAVSSDKDMGFTYTLAFRKQPQAGCGKGGVRPGHKQPQARAQG